MRGVGSKNESDLSFPSFPLVQAALGVKFQWWLPDGSSYSPWAKVESGHFGLFPEPLEFGEFHTVKLSKETVVTFLVDPDEMAVVLPATNGKFLKFATTRPETILVPTNEPADWWINAMVSLAALRYILTRHKDTRKPHAADGGMPQIVSQGAIFHTTGKRNSSKLFSSFLRKAIVAATTPEKIVKNDQIAEIVMQAFSELGEEELTTVLAENCEVHGLEVQDDLVDRVRSYVLCRKAWMVAAEARAHHHRNPLKEFGKRFLTFAKDPTLENAQRVLLKTMLAFLHRRFPWRVVPLLIDYCNDLQPVVIHRESVARTLTRSMMGDEYRFAEQLSLPCQKDKEEIPREKEYMNRAATHEQNQQSLEAKVVSSSSSSSSSMGSDEAQYQVRQINLGRANLQIS